MEITLDERIRPSIGVTLTDVANLAGVGESTVSRVLRNRGAVSSKTRARVDEAVATLGYVPNRIAGTLASAGSQLVGIVIPSLANIVFPDVLRGANAVLEAAGFQPVIGVTDYDPAREDAVIASMRAWRPAALMVAGLDHTERTRRLLLASGARIIELLDTDGEGIDLVVGFSNRRAGQASAEHLLGRGYRRIGYVGHDIARDRRAAKRLLAFTETLAAAGFPLQDRELLPGFSSVEAGRAALERLLARTPALDAVYFSNDDMAIGGIFHCQAHGIAVPGMLALFGYNGLDIGAAMPQALSTVRTPRVAIGETAARLFVEQAAAQTIDLGFEIVEGQTA